MLRKIGNFLQKKQIQRFFSQTQLFSEISNISSETVNNLERHGYTRMTNIQQATFNKVFNQQNIIARDQTGQGKTLAFALPLVERFRQEKKLQKSKGPLVLVLTPTRELAIQVFQQFEKLKNFEDEFKCSVLFGGSGSYFVQDQLQGNIDFLIATPGRLLGSLRADQVSLNKLESLVLDETDTMLNMGFEEDMNTIFKSIPENKSKDIQCVLFSATIPKWVTQISKKSFDRDFEMINMVKESQDAIPKNIQNYLCPVDNDNHKAQLLADIVLNQLKKKFDSKILVFVNKKSSVQTIVNSSYFISRISACFTGDLSQSHRQYFLQGFRQGIFKCLICTDIASRGLDIDDVDLVIQYDLQNDPEQFVHRAGRVGRMNKQGFNIFFVESLDKMLFKKITQKYKFSYKQFDNYIQNHFLEEMKSHNYDAQLSEINDNQEINIRIKLKDRYKTSEEKDQIVAEFRDYLKQNSDIQIYTRLYDENLDESDKFAQIKNKYTTVLKKDVEKLENLAKTFNKDLYIYPQSQMHTETKKILNKIDVGDIDISEFFQQDVLFIKGYNSEFSEQFLENQCINMVKQGTITEVPIIISSRTENGYTLRFQNKKDVSRFLMEASNSRLGRIRVDVTLFYKRFNKFQMNKQKKKYRSENPKNESHDYMKSQYQKETIEDFQLILKY